MDFLNPLYLFLLSAASLPLLIHLLSRRKIPEIPFSSLRFIKRSDRRSMKKINLRRLILLILRMAAIASVALAFSRPVITGGLAALFPGGGPKAICILLDRSYSMAVTGRDGQLMDRAKRSVSMIAESASSEDEVKVILFDEGSELLFEGERFTPAAAKEMTDKVEVSWFATSLRQAVERGIAALEAGRRAEKELYIVSDLQRSALLRGGMEGRGKTGGRKEDGEGGQETQVRAYMVPVQYAEGANVSIDEVLTPRVAIHRGEPAPIKVVLRNHSSTAGAKFPLRVSLDGKIVLEREMTIPPLSARTERFELPVEKAGWIKGEVFKNPDRQRYDDRRFFTIFSRERLEVLLLGGAEDIYIKTALDPEGAAGDIEVREISWEDMTTGDLDRAEAVVTGTALPSSPAEVAILRRYVSRGGKALIFLSGRSAERLKGLSSHELSIRAVREGGIRTLREPGEVPGFLGPFGREDLRNLSRVRFTDGVEVEGVPGEEVLLSFRDGAPFVWRERYGSGVIMFVATEPGPAGGELVLSPLFLPLVQQAVLAMDPGEPAAPGLATGGEMMIEGEPDVEYHVTLADGSSRRLLPAAEGGRATAEAGRGNVPEGGGASGPDRAAAAAVPLVVPAGDTPGHIEVEGGERTVLVAAVNPPVLEESRQELMTGTEAADSLGLEHYTVLEEGARITGGIREAREGREISAHLAVLALVLLVAELLVSQRREMAVGDL